MAWYARDQVTTQRSKWPQHISAAAWSTWASKSDIPLSAQYEVLNVNVLASRVSWQMPCFLKIRDRVDIEEGIAAEIVD